MDNLNDALLAAHALNDRIALVDLYTKAADATTHIDAACFYLTHAYVYALEIDHPAQSLLYDRLKAEGRI